MADAGDSTPSSHTEAKQDDTAQNVVVVKRRPSSGTKTHHVVSPPPASDNPEMIRTARAKQNRIDTLTAQWEEEDKQYIQRQRGLNVELKKCEAALVSATNLGADSYEIKAKIHEITVQIEKDKTDHADARAARTQTLEDPTIKLTDDEKRIVRGIQAAEKHKPGTSTPPPRIGSAGHTRQETSPALKPAKPVQQPSGAKQPTSPALQPQSPSQSPQRQLLSVEDAAAVRIQSGFRGFMARKNLKGGSANNSVAGSDRGSSAGSRRSSNASTASAAEQHQMEMDLLKSAKAKKELQLQLQQEWDEADKQYNATVKKMKAELKTVSDKLDAAKVFGHAKSTLSDAEALVLMQQKINYTEELELLREKHREVLDARAQRLEQPDVKLDEDDKRALRGATAIKTQRQNAPATTNANHRFTPGVVSARENRSPRVSPSVTPRDDHHIAGGTDHPEGSPKPHKVSRDHPASTTSAPKAQTPPASSPIPSAGVAVAVSPPPTVPYKPGLLRKGSSDTLPKHVPPADHSIHMEVMNELDQLLEREIKQFRPLRSAAVAVMFSVKAANNQLSPLNNAPIPTWLVNEPTVIRGMSVTEDTLGLKPGQLPPLT